MDAVLLRVAKTVRFLFVRAGLSVHGTNETVDILHLIAIFFLGLLKHIRKFDPFLTNYSKRMCLQGLRSHFLFVVKICLPSSLSFSFSISCTVIINELSFAKYDSVSVNKSSDRRKEGMKLAGTNHYRDEQGRIHTLNRKKHSPIVLSKLCSHQRRRLRILSFVHWQNPSGKDVKQTR